MTAALGSAASALPRLAEQINEAHAEALRSGREMVMHSLRAGAAMIEAKEQVPHGAWGAWLENNFDGSVRTAQLYMRLARHPEKAQRLAHLGLAGIAAALANPKRATPPKRAMPEHPVGVADGPLHEEGEWPERRSALVRDAFLALGEVADRAVALAEPHEREAMERDRAAVIHELQVYADRALAITVPESREPWALVNGLPAFVHIVRPGQRAPVRDK